MQTEDEFYATLTEHPTPTAKPTPKMDRLFEAMGTPCIECGELPLIYSKVRKLGEVQFCSEDCLARYQGLING